jgi:thioredoxin-related protein
MKIKNLFVLFMLLGTIAVAHAQSVQPEAATVLKEAQKKAEKEKKNVFVIFHASWCSWCKKMEANMENEACKKFFDDNYVITHLTVMESEKNKHLENPGADELLKKYKAEKQGIPFWVVLDHKGNLMADSFNSEGQNLGCPASKGEVKEFVAKLKKTTKMDTKQLQIIANVFEIKKSK